MPKILIALLSCVVLVSPARADVISFGPTSGTPVGIAGSDDGTGNLITYSSALIWGGTAQSSTHHSTSGTITDSLGHTDPYDGTFFDSAVDGDPTLTTLIASTSRNRIDGGIADDYANYIGFRVTFSAPIEMFSFGFVDMDGDISAGQNEWAASFAYNSNTTTTFIPTATLGDGNLAALAPAGTTVDWNLPGAPATYGVAFSNFDNGNLRPSDAESQVKFDYVGNLVTDMYFLLGTQGTDGGNGRNNSGVTGFAVLEPASVPEPSSAMLLGIGALLLAKRRKKADLCQA